MNPAETALETALEGDIAPIQLQGFFRILGLQLVLVLLTAVISAWIAGSAGFWSAFGGGFVYVVPSAVTTLIFVASVRTHTLHPMSAFVLKACRLGMALLLLGVIGFVYRHQLVWPAFLIGLLVALKAVWVLVFTRLL